MPYWALLEEILFLFPCLLYGQDVLLFVVILVAELLVLLLQPLSELVFLLQVE